MADVVNIQPVVKMIASVLNGVDARLAVTSLQYVLCEAVRLQYDGQAGPAALQIIETTLNHYRQFPDPHGVVNMDEENPVTHAERH